MLFKEIIPVYSENQTKSITSKQSSPHTTPPPQKSNYYSRRNITPSFVDRYKYTRKREGKTAKR
jgi:hypothetical protein